MYSYPKWTSGKNLSVQDNQVIIRFPVKFGLQEKNLPDQDNAIIVKFPVNFGLQEKNFPALDNSVIMKFPVKGPLQTYRNMSIFVQEYEKKMLRRRN